MKAVGIVFLGVGIGILVFLFLQGFSVTSSVISPIPEGEGIRVIMISPSPQ